MTKREEREREGERAREIAIPDNAVVRLRLYERTSSSRVGRALADSCWPWTTAIQTIETPVATVPLQVGASSAADVLFSLPSPSSGGSFELFRRIAAALYGDGRRQAAAGGRFGPGNDIPK